MIKAVDASGKLYSVWQADRAQIGELFCPFCEGPVFSRHYAKDLRKDDLAQATDQTGGVL